MPHATQRDDAPPRLGAKVRALRRRESLSQSQFAEHLGVSPSYVNLIENNRRPLPAPLLIKMAQLFGVDLASFGDDDDTRLVADLLEAFSDPLFDAHDMTSVDVREVSTGSPATARTSSPASHRAPRPTAPWLRPRLARPASERAAW